MPGVIQCMLPASNTYVLFTAASRIEPECCDAAGQRHRLAEFAPSQTSPPSMSMLLSQRRTTTLPAGYIVPASTAVPYLGAQWCLCLNATTLQPSTRSTSSGCCKVVQFHLQTSVQPWGRWCTTLYKHFVLFRVVVKGGCTVLSSWQEVGASS